MRPGPRNALTDVEGLLVGHAADHEVRSGVTVVTAEAPFTAAVHVMGGAPGTRETDLLAPDKLVQAVDALVLAGGSAFGLDAASGVADGLRTRGRGFDVGDGLTVPIVPSAILFDLRNGGAKAWTDNPYRRLGLAALEGAQADVPEGSVGAGIGATTRRLRGGLGTASAHLPNGATVGALVAVNAHGDVTVGGGRHFWAAPWELSDEFGGLGAAPGTAFDPAQPAVLKSDMGATTIAIVATDAKLTQAECQRVAIAAHDGIARAIVPSHTPFDGDLVFAASMGSRVLADPLRDLTALGHAAACCLARSIARAIYHAAPAPEGMPPAWSDLNDS